MTPVRVLVRADGYAPREGGHELVADTGLVTSCSYSRSSAKNVAQGGTSLRRRFPSSAKEFRGELENALGADDGPVQVHPPRLGGGTENTSATPAAWGPGGQKGVRPGHTKTRTGVRGRRTGRGGGGPARVMGQRPSGGGVRSHPRPAQSSGQDGTSD